MDKLTNKKVILESLLLSEGTEFQCNEKDILDEYQIHEANKSNLAIKVLSIFGGLLATLAFLISLGIAGFYDSESGFVIFGFAFIVFALWMNKTYDKLITDTFSISIYIIGYALLSWGLTELEIDENVIMILTSSIALFSLSITQNYILSFISVLIISVGILSLIFLNEAYNLIHLYIIVNTLIMVYFFINEAKLISLNKKLSKLYDPIRIGLIISLLFGLITIGKKQLIPISQNYIWLSSVIMILVVAYLVQTIIKITQVESSKSKILIYSLGALILISTVPSPAILGALVIILLSFLVNYKTGLVIGVIALIYFISQYYYDLSFTLLTKSIILFSSGIAFLLLYLFTNKKLNNNEKV